ncbi:MAG: glycosyltransferase [Bacteroidia bacterium]|nr:glycosyltransferase [Bacteroidia bacterium]
MMLLVACISLFTLYSILIIYYWQSWRSVPDYISNDQSAQIKISVIIAARNEEENIRQLLLALQQQTYPKQYFEIIVVDDNSKDSTSSVVKEFPEVILLQTKNEGINSGKKKAIETGIAGATGELIVTTDADCLPGKEWLQTISSFKKEKQPVFIVAPVILTSSEKRHRLLSVFQQLDFLVLQGITAASVYRNIHSMCNGANLAYERKTFYDVNGFKGIDDIASGDDMLLMHKIWKKYPHQVYYLKSKDVLVATNTMKTWKEFFNQRIRWASKAGRYDDKRIFFVLLLVYLFNLSFGVLLVAGCWHHEYWFWLIGMCIGKTILEFPFVNSVAIFFNKQSLVKYFFLFQPLHIFYTILSGLFGQFGKYEWKGRKVR